MKDRFLNIFLRSISMGGRFVLIFSIAKLFTPTQLGVFGLLSSGIGFFILFVGFNYYSYSNRNLVAHQTKDYPKLILNQLYAYIPLYFIVLPFSFLFFYQDILPIEYFGWFIILVIVEHISTEQHRLLNITQHQLKATMVLFLKSASWVFIVIPLTYIFPDLREIDILLMGWFIGNVLAIYFGSKTIYSFSDNWKFIKPDYEWILKGYRVGFLFFMGTLAIQAVSFLDKYFLKYMSDSQMVGVYTFYLTLIMGITAFIHAGLIVFLSPKIVKAFQDNEIENFFKLLDKFFKELAVASVVMAICLYLFLPLIVSWIGKEIYENHNDIFYILIFMGIFSVLSNHPHTFLYASQKDRYMLFSNISGLVSFLISFFVLYSLKLFEPLYIVALSMVITFGWLLLIKYIGYFYYKKEMI
jgi:O-antigen/teichoic acid export membrane protein